MGEYLLEECCSPPQTSVTLLWNLWHREVKLFWRLWWNDALLRPSMLLRPFLCHPFVDQCWWQILVNMKAQQATAFLLDFLLRLQTSSFLHYKLGKLSQKLFTFDNLTMWAHVTGVYSSHRKQSLIKPQQSCLHAHEYASGSVHLAQSISTSPVQAITHHSGKSSSSLQCRRQPSRRVLTTTMQGL